ncbi:TadA family conjugal transfer-associated ATPase [Kineococcus terrestris]|uniref:TadA family conjugal transfer-associated ATPase n=1 Tax=Kineococcus terrestris TaxID=2044856 RepID=UPI0034DB5846
MSAGTAAVALDPGVVARVRDRLLAGPAVPTGLTGDRGLTERVAVAARAEGLVLGAPGLLRLVDAVRAELTGCGRLQPLVEAPGTTDVLVNGGGRVWVDDGGGLRAAATALSGEEEVRELAVRLAATAGRRLDDASPWVDARLPDGTRLHAVLPPLTPEGTHLSLRVPARRRWSLAQLEAAGSVPAAWGPLLRAVVAGRLSYLVSGGTGTGKTTLLQALLGEVGARERLVLVEDAGELRPEHPHVVRLEARHGNVEGRGAVGLDVLVRQALRMRPDRLVVGECRGAEVLELLAALNTGHAGSAGTLHANSAADVVARVHALAASAGAAAAAVDAQLLAGVDVVLHTGRAGGARALLEVAVLEGVGTGPARGARAVPALTRCPDGDGADAWRTGPGWPQLAARLPAAVTGPLADGRGRA